MFRQITVKKIKLNKLNKLNTVTRFYFSKKDSSARRAMRTKLLFKISWKFSDKMSVLKPPYCKILGLYFTTCSSEMKFRPLVQI